MLELIRVNNSSKVLDNLYVGGIPSLKDISNYSAVVCVTSDILKMADDRVHYYPFNDDKNNLPPEEFINKIVDKVIALLSQGVVYVHCSAGINRSIMIVALVLVRLGWHPAEAVNHLRQVRSPEIFSNKLFLSYVMSKSKSAILQC